MQETPTLRILGDWAEDVQHIEDLFFSEIKPEVQGVWLSSSGEPGEELSSFSFAHRGVHREGKVMGECSFAFEELKECGGHLGWGDISQMKKMETRLLTFML